MRIDINEDVKQMAAASQNNTFVKQMDKSGVSGSDVGAVFQNGVAEHYIENMAMSGSEGLDAAESMDNKQMQNQLSAMANTMNEEELNSIKEETESIEDEEIKTIVTVQEKIRMQLAAYCDDFDSGIVEEFSQGELAAIGKMQGNAAVWAKKLKEKGFPVTENNLENIKYGLELANKIPPVSEGVKEFFVRNTNRPVTIEALYLASYSAMTNVMTPQGDYYSVQAGGYLAQNTVSDDFSNLLPQIEGILADEGIVADSNVMENVKWLYDNRLPINGDTILRLDELQQIQLPASEEELLSKMMDAMYEGKLPADAILTGDTNTELVKKASEIINTVENITDSQIKAAVAVNGNELSIAAINNVVSDSVAINKGSQINDTDISFVTAKRQIEEIRLQMTVGSVVMMEKQGISVDITGLSQLIENLKTIENNYMSAMLESGGVPATVENIDLFSKVNSAVEVIKNSPAHLVGRMAFEQENVSLEQLENEGDLLTKKYKSAEAVYETVMTKPRADMGDSIKTAFRNVDDILKSMDLEVNIYNQRAVRILGYNSMEITHSNVEIVKQADMEVNQMLSHIHPSSVIRMIRENYNPMLATVSELNEKLQEYEENSFVNEAKYSEFLWSMEQKNEISAREREAYIGIYRLVNQIEKSDGALVGALVSQGADLTMENLLSAWRTRKRGAMDYVVNDEFTGVDSGTDNKISTQIENGFVHNKQDYYGKLAQNIIDNITPAALHEAEKHGNIMDMTIEQLAQYIHEYEVETKSEDYTGYQLEILRNMAGREKQVLSMLADYNIPVTLNNMIAANQLMDNQGNWLKKMFKQEALSDTSSLSEAEYQILIKAQGLVDSLQDAKTMQDAYGDFADEASKMLHEGIVEENDTFIDVRTMKLLSTQLNMATSMTKEETYQIPVMLGKEMTAINLKFRYNTGEDQKVGISMETHTFGAVFASFSLKGTQVTGYVMTATSEGVSYFNEAKETFASILSESTSFQMGTVSVVQHSSVSSSDIWSNVTANAEMNRVSGKIRNNEAVNTDSFSSKDFYQIAKVFIETVKITCQ